MAAAAAGTSGSVGGSGQSSFTSPSGQHDTDTLEKEKKKGKSRGSRKATVQGGQSVRVLVAHEEAKEARPAVSQETTVSLFKWPRG